MINRVLALLRQPADAPRAKTGADERHLAAAALLVRAASIDTRFDAEERATIRRLLEQRLALSHAEADTLLGAAEAAAEASNQLLGFTRTIKDRFSYDERVALMEMLWSVVYADGHADEYERQLLRRIAGLIYVTDRDSGLARQRARRGAAG